MSDTPPVLKQRSPRWVRAWVTQELVGTGKTCEILKWVREDRLKILKEKSKEPEPEEPKPEPTTEILFLCSYEGCNKAFSTEGAYRKHCYTHGERQHTCTYPGCEKKFKDSSKLKRHQVVHTREKKYFCPYEGCGRTSAVDMMKQTRLADKIHSTVTATAVNRSCPSSDRSHVCPYEGCGKAYIYNYRLVHHLKNQHADRNPEDSNRCGRVIGDAMEEASDQDVYIANGAVANYHKRSKPNLLHQMPPATLSRQKGSPSAHASTYAIMQQNPSQESCEEDSEETEDEVENIAESCRYQKVSSGGDDEVTEDEE